MLNIKSPEADRLARQLAQYMGETITHVITEALRERAPIELKESLSAISHHCAQLPDQNQQVLEKFLTYDQFGLAV